MEQREDVGGFLWREMLSCCESHHSPGRDEGYFHFRSSEGASVGSLGELDVCSLQLRTMVGGGAGGGGLYSQLRERWCCAGLDLEEFPWTREKELAGICLNPNQEQRKGTLDSERMCGVDLQERGS